MRPIKKYILIATLCGISAINTAFSKGFDCSVSTTSDQHELSINELRTFDIKSFNRYGYMDSHYLTLPNSIEVWQRGDQENGYIEEIRYPNSPYMCYFVYDKKGQLITQGNKFYGSPVGITITYNKNGDIIMQTHWDTDYPFSIAQLAEKMKHDFSIDILNINQTKTVIRFIDKLKNNEPYYEIYLYNKNYGYLVDGTTGELLFQSQLELGSRDGEVENIFYKYQESLTTK